MLKSDVISRETIEPVKMTILGFLTAIFLLIALFDPNAVHFSFLLNGDSSITLGFHYGIVFIITNLFANSIYIITLVKIAINAPRDVKKWAYFYLTGEVLIGYFSTVLYLVYPPLSWILLGAGAFLMSLAVVKQPKIIFVLPFKAFRLTVMENTSGLPLFTHTWNTGDVLADETLDAAMLQAINLFVKESLGKGDLKEVHVSDAVILVKQFEDFPVVSVVIATKPSRTLREGLDIFAKRFCEEYKEHIGKPVDQTMFADAKKLIKEGFPYVPEFN